jgi:hypothetical protein
VDRHGAGGLVSRSAVEQRQVKPKLRLCEGNYIVDSPTPKAFAKSSPGQRPGYRIRQDMQTLKEFASALNVFVEDLYFTRLLRCSHVSIAIIMSGTGVCELFQSSSIAWRLLTQG